MGIGFLISETHEVQLKKKAQKNSDQMIAIFKIYSTLNKKLFIMLQQS
ncbi:hypothetical protein MCERE19_02445 [Spirosomataceae bacterium]|jgi:hypothetical protein